MKNCKIVINLAEKLIFNAPELLKGKPEINTQLLVVFSADRGLCGGFNGSITRAVKSAIIDANSKKIETILLLVGRKSADALRREFKENFFEVITGNSANPKFNDSSMIAKKIIDLFKQDKFGTCKIVYNKFISAISQEVTFKSLIPVEFEVEEDKDVSGSSSVYEYEPSEEEILEDLLSRNISTLLFAIKCS